MMMLLLLYEYNLFQILDKTTLFITCYQLLLRIFHCALFTFPNYCVNQNTCCMAIYIHNSVYAPYYLWLWLVTHKHAYQRCLFIYFTAKKVCPNHGLYIVPCTEGSTAFTYSTVAIIMQSCTHQVKTQTQTQMHTDIKHTFLEIEMCISRVDENHCLYDFKSCLSVCLFYIPTHAYTNIIHTLCTHTYTNIYTCT